MKLTKITLAVLVGVVGVLAGTGVGVGVGSAVFGSDTTTSESRPWGALEDLPSKGKLPVVLVTDGGVVNDKSFNQQAYEAFTKVDVPGVKDGLSEAIYGKVSTRIYVQPTSTDAADLEDGYATAIASLGTSVSVGGQSIMRKVIVAPGFYHSTGIKTFQADNPNDNTKFVVLDSTPTWSNFTDNTSGTLKNVYGITFDTKKAAFQAGYLAGLYLEAKGDTTPKVGTFGGGNFPGVTDFMVGFVAGIRYYNDNNGNAADVTFAKFATATEYTDSGFAAGGGQAKAERLLGEDADIILPVAGPQTNDVITAINASQDKDRLKVIGVDNDQSKSYPDDADKFLTSVRKNVRRASIEGYKAAVGLPNSLGAPVDTYEAEKSYHYHVGLEGKYTGYVEQFGDSVSIVTSTTWGDLYDKIRMLKPRDIGAVLVGVAEGDTDKTLEAANWADALAYINDH